MWFYYNSKSSGGFTACKLKLYVYMCALMAGADRISIASGTAMLLNISSANNLNRQCRLCDIT